MDLNLRSLEHFQRIVLIARRLAERGVLFVQLFHRGCDQLALRTEGKLRLACIGFGPRLKATREAERHRWISGGELLAARSTAMAN